MKHSVCLLALALVLGACAPKPTVVVPTKDGTLVAGESGGRISTKEGTTTWQTDRDGKASKVETTDAQGNKSSFAMGQRFDPAEFGLPLAPGATVTEGSISSMDTPEAKSRVVGFTTKEGPEQVVAFYKARLDSVEFSQETESMRSVVGKLADGAQVTVVANAKDGLTEVMLSVVREVR